MELGLDRLADPRPQALVPASRAFYAARTPRRGPADDAEVLAARAAAATPAASAPPPSVELARAGGREVTVRVHVPAGPVAGAHLQLHGGGFFLGSAAPDDDRDQALADALGLVVVGVEHRRAPAGRRIAGEHFLQAYAGAVEDRTHPDVSPVFADCAACRRCSSS